MTKRLNSSTTKPKIILGLMALALFCLFFFLNRLYPIILDDWTYSFVYFTTDRVASFSDALKSQYDHYFIWGGRSVVHTILQTILYWGEEWADLLNSLAFVGLVGIIYTFANKGNKPRPSLFLFAFLCIWFFQPDMGETTLWLTGSVNYLWGTLFILLFLYPYYSYFRDVVEAERYHCPAYKTNPLFYIFFFLCGLITGWTNENTVAAMLLLIFIFALFIWKIRGKFETWAIVGYIGAIIGFIIMFLAPGNYKRYSIELRQLGIHSKPSFDFYWERFNVLCSDFIHYGWAMLLLFAILIIIYVASSKKGKDKPIIAYALFFVGLAIISALAMTASPVFFPRTWFGIFIFFIIGLSILYANLDFGKSWLKYSSWFILSIAFLGFVITCYKGTEELIRIKAIIDNREKELYEQKAQGKDHIVLHGGRYAKREDLIIPKMYDFPEDTTLWMFQEYNRYHGVKSTRIED